MILLDTHVLVWLDQDTPQLGTSCRMQADIALADGDLAVSAISFWEVAMLVHKNPSTWNYWNGVATSWQPEYVS